MRGAAGFLRGAVTAEVACRRPERFFNLCAEEGIAYRRLRNLPDGRLSAEFGEGDFRRLCALSSGDDFSVREVKRWGAPSVLRWMRGRKMLWAGLALCVSGVWFSSFFILELDVTGNERVPEGEILSALEELGVGIGTFRFAIPHDRVANEMLIKIPELSWIAVNCTGSRADVLVREESPRPEVYDASVPADITAAKEGIIVSMDVLAGERVKNVGEAAAKGDVLVKGASGNGSGIRALANVAAITRYELSAQTALRICEKRYTGRKAERSAIVFAGKRLNLYFSCGNPYVHCDKIILEKKVTLFSLAVLPVTVITETFSEYEPSAAEYDRSEAENMLKARLRGRLSELLTEGEVVSEEFFTSERGGMLKTVLCAECREEIGVTHEYTQEELLTYGRENR